MKAMKQKMEESLGYRFSDDEFEEAFGQAKRKQDLLYEREKREAVKEPWYLAELVKEYMRNLALSKLTLDFCGIVKDMEKEHLFNEEQGAPTDNHILTLFAE